MRKKKMTTNMKISRKTSKTLAITLILAFAIMTAIPLVRAIEIPTYAYVVTAPNPVGVNQKTIVSLFVDKVSPTATMYYREGNWENYTVTITKPDESQDHRVIPYADAASTAWFELVPDQVGTWEIEFYFPGQTIVVGETSNTYLPSTSDVMELEVQEEQIEWLPNNPYPEGYWERPINAENKGWYNFADNWLMQNYDTTSRSFCVTATYAPYTSAPNTSHVLWKKPIIFGGQPGGMFEDQSYYSGLAYEQHYLPLIVQGQIIYAEHTLATSAVHGTRCLDLYTGEEIWYLPGVNILFVQLFDFDSGNEHGIVPMMWEVSGRSPNTVATIYDPMTGTELFSIENITWGGTGSFSGGPTAFGPNGEVLSYSFNSDRSRLICWNSTRAIMGTAYNSFNPGLGRVYDGNRGIEYNVSIPDVRGDQSISCVDDGYILAQWRDDDEYPYVYVDTCYDQETGQQLWSEEHEIYSAYFGRPVHIGSGIYVMRDEARNLYDAFSIENGNYLWSTDPFPTGYGVFTYQADIAYDMVYMTGYEGYVWAFNADDGTLAWKYYLGSAGYENAYGTYPTYNGFTIADGKIYVGNDEHSPNSEMWRGGKLWCIDAYTGDLIWSVSGWLRNPAIADGILTALNSLDGQAYTFGIGPSKTTVSVPASGVTLGNNVMITGSVLDQSPAQKDTACVSDAYMDEWMNYLHAQQAMPEICEGVTVKLSSYDPNGNYQDIGVVTTDIHGNFGKSWEAPVPGEYYILAEFEGTESYGPSSATAYFVVDEAAPTTPIEPEQPTEQPTEPEPEAPFITTEIAIIAAVAIVAVVGIAAYFVLRRRQ
jgi:hypothetical protein